MRADPEQEKAIMALDRLHGEIMLEHLAAKGWLRRRIGSALGKLARRTEEIPKGVYMYGGVGRGKSMLMDMFYSALPQGLKKRRVHFHTFMIEVHEYFHSRRQADDISEGVDDLIPSLASVIRARAQVLCFDEFHVTDVTDAMILGRLFSTLFDRGVIVVATSNWAPDDLYKGGLQRERFLPFIDLLKKRMDVVHLESETDYRATCLREEGSYFAPLNDDAKSKADEVFSLLTQGQVPHREILKVKGHNIVVNRAVDGVARFSFAQLCESAYGAEDYFKIADTYHTIFVENVPMLGKDDRNEAKRFMTLIDALYETGTKLVVTAATQPEELSKGHDHAFEFERTVSRLKEMQSKAYLNKEQSVHT